MIEETTDYGLLMDLLVCRIAVYVTGKMAGNYLVVQMYE